jgi:hypothetical protein
MGFALGAVQPTENCIEFGVLDPWTLEAINNLGEVVYVPQQNYSQWLLYPYSGSIEAASLMILKYEGGYYNFTKLWGCDYNKFRRADVLEGVFATPALNVRSVFIGPAWAFVGVGWIALGIVAFKRKH